MIFRWLWRRRRLYFITLIISILSAGATVICIWRARVNDYDLTGYDQLQTRGSEIVFALSIPLLLILWKSAKHSKPMRTESNSPYSIPLSPEEKRLLLPYPGDRIELLPCYLQSKGAVSGSMPGEIYSFTQADNEGYWMRMWLDGRGLAENLGNEVLLLVHYHKTTPDWDLEFEEIHAIAVISMQKDVPPFVNPRYEYLRYRPWQGSRAVGSYIMLAFYIAMGFTVLGLIMVLMFFRMGIPSVHFNYQYVCLTDRNVTLNQQHCVDMLAKKYRQERVKFGRYFRRAGGMDKTIA